MNSKHKPSSLAVSLSTVALGAILALTASAAMAQPADGDSPHQAGRLPLKERPHGDAPVIRTVIDAVGLIRGVGPGETTKTVNRLRWGGDGEMTEGGHTYKLSRYDYSVSLLQQAAREDIQRVGPDGAKSRVVKVVAGADAWNESVPGVATDLAQAQAKARKLQFWRTPFGIAKALTLAPAGSVKVTDSGSGPVQLDFVVEAAPVHVVLDKDYRPFRVEQQVGKDKVVDEYTDYADLSEYGLMFARHIVETVNGKPSLDVHIHDADVATYIVFPRPTKLVASK